MKKNEKKEETLPVRFTNMVVSEFTGVIGNLPDNFDEKKKKLTQHLFIKIDADLKALEKKRSWNNLKQNDPAISWENINMPKLAVDSMRRVELGLDALIPNHISVIPYLNKRTNLYEIDLRTGYEGKNYYTRKMALDIPVNITYRLVYDSDEFIAIMKSFDQPIESYSFKIINPFKRGKIIGGFGYIEYKDKIKNELILVSEDDFKKIEKENNFWIDFPIQMRFKTLVHRTTEKILLDPDKINSSYSIVEAEERIERIEDAKDKRQLIDLTPEPEIKPDKKEAVSEKEIEQKEEGVQNAEPEPEQEKSKDIATPGF